MAWQSGTCRLRPPIRQPGQSRPSSAQHQGTAQVDRHRQQLQLERVARQGAIAHPAIAIPALHGREDALDRRPDRAERPVAGWSAAVSRTRLAALRMMPSSIRAVPARSGTTSHGSPCRRTPPLVAPKDPIGTRPRKGTLSDTFAGVSTAWRTSPEPGRPRHAPCSRTRASSGIAVPARIPVAAALDRRTLPRPAAVGRHQARVDQGAGLDHQPPGSRAAG